MFGRWLNQATKVPDPPAAAGLENAVRTALPEADQETVLVVVAIAGLLAAVAYADRKYSPEEAQRVRTELGRLHGMTQASGDAVTRVLEANLIELSTIETPRFCRVLRELGDTELRLEVLAMLVDIAAEDGVISSEESNVLRRLTGALGLSQGDYNAFQAKHRERLGVLR